MKMKKYTRLISVGIAILMTAQLMPYYVPAASAALSADASGYIHLDGATVSHMQTLTDIGNGIYRLQLTLQSVFQLDDANINSRQSKNGYFTAQHNGEYLIELWGGSGADGKATNFSEGGSGGAGGYVYGTIYLNAGETIYYAIGGNGAQTLSNDEGGGVNGDGGNHGDTGSYTVGGGGGYSAVYKLGKGEFDKYLDAEGNLITDNIDENDRVSKYIMIAGGGGGGGAGNGFAIGAQATGTPDGGAAGSIGSTQGELFGDAYDVPGTFFAGSDGKSSGTSAAYVGHGGTSLPGYISDTLLTFYEGEEPNDWRGTYNPDKPGGHGSAGNLRGGGGGAGFCGGSGGIMTGLLAATNVGGGGGGSSFIAQSVNYNLDETAKRYLTGVNTSETGGSIAVTFLGVEDNDFLDNLHFSAAASQYFDILGVTSHKGREESGVVESTVQHFSITGASVKPGTEGQSGLPLFINIYLRAKDGFAGGNNVPLLLNNAITCEAGDGIHGADTILLDETCSAVNVPLNFELITHSYTTNTPGDPHAVSNFYTDSYADARDNPAGDWRYHFISAISPYTVTDESGAAVSGTVAPERTTRYTVSFTVTPHPAGSAVVGDINEQTVYTGTAAYILAKPGGGDLNGNQITYTKSLTFDNDSGQYRLELSIHSDSTGLVPTLPDPGIYEYPSESGTYTITQDGYYLIQAWGGDGGDGRKTALIDFGGDNTDGGPGGTGGYVSGYIHLSAGDTISIDSIGADGANGAFRDNPGKGGSYTQVVVTKNGAGIDALIAGGGGGGGRSFDRGLIDDIVGQPGGDVSDTPQIGTAFSTDKSVYAGGNGVKESNTGEAGAAGISFKNSAMDVSEDGSHALYPETLEKINTEFSKDDYTNNGGGAVHITCVQMERDLSHVQDAQGDELTDYALHAQISKYFDVAGISGTNLEDGSQLEMTAGAGVDNLVTVTGIQPLAKFTTAPSGEGDGTAVYASVDFSITLLLIPKEGFLGGNDVPVLVRDGSSGAGTDGMQLSQKDAYIPIVRQDFSDFANVAIPYTPSLQDLDVFEKTYILGDTPIPKSDLFLWNDPIQATGDWREDFVDILDPSSDSTLLAPWATTYYPITVGITPNTAQPQHATVIPAVQPATITKEAAIYVKTEIFYQLTNMTADHAPDENGRYTLPAGEDYTATLTPESGYLMPEHIFVTVDGKEISHTFDPTTGQLNVPAKGITGAMTITAAGEVREYTLHYLYELYPGGPTGHHEEKYEAGETIIPWEGHTPEEFEHYSFQWDWDNGSDTPLAQMPPSDWWVNGQYLPESYSVIINYYYAGTEDPIASPVTKTLPYGSAYQIESPTIDGFAPDLFVVSGKVTGDPATDMVNVYYTSTKNQLRIIYMLQDTKEVIGAYTETLNVGGAFDIPSPEHTGYTPGQERVTGAMTPEGKTFVVYYDPNAYTVAFDADGGTCSTAEKTVIYNNLYGYDKATDTYAALPTPIKVGYIFDGWYLGGKKITEDTSVQTAGDHTLTAKWKALDFTLTIRYIFQDGAQAALQHTATLSVGQEYTVTSPTLIGYTADLPVVTGAIAAQNRVITVTYTANEYTLRIEYVYEKDGTQAAAPFSAVVAYQGAYAVPSPGIEGFYASASEVSGAMGAGDFTTTVYYYEEEPVISVTVSWGNLTYLYTHGAWDPENHTYDTPSIAPEEIGKNTVTVQNHTESNVRVDAALSYQPAGGYEGLGAYFTESGETSPRIRELLSIAPGESAAAYVWLEGTLPRSITSSIISGTCTVTIQGGKHSGISDSAP